MSATETNSQINLAAARRLLADHFPGRTYPEGFLIDLYKAIREAEMRGFAECLSFFEPRHRAANDQGGAS